MCVCNGAMYQAYASFPQNYWAYLHTPSDDAYSDVVDASARAVQSTVALSDPYYNYLYDGRIDPRLAGNLGGPWGGKSASVETLRSYAPVIPSASTASTSYATAADSASFGTALSSSLLGLSADDLIKFSADDLIKFSADDLIKFSADDLIRFSAGTQDSFGSFQGAPHSHLSVPRSSSFSTPRTTLSEVSSFGSGLTVASEDVPLRQKYGAVVVDNPLFADETAVNDNPLFDDPLPVETTVVRAPSQQMTRDDAIALLQAGDGQMAAAVASTARAPRAVSVGPVDPQPWPAHPGQKPGHTTNKRRLAMPVRKVPTKLDPADMRYKETIARDAALTEEAQRNALDRGNSAKRAQEKVEREQRVQMLRDAIETKELARRQVQMAAARGGPELQRRERRLAEDTHAMRQFDKALNKAMAPRGK